MCTLSWVTTESGYRLLFNRDERLCRAAARSPIVHEDKGGSFVAPIDPEGDGTWISCNEHGVTLCLLNDYEGDSSPLSKTEPRSRGLLVKELALAKSEQEVFARLTSMDLRHYPPFVLVVFAPDTGPCLWRHDASGQRLTLAPKCPVSSSGERSAEVLKYRKAAFLRALKKSGAFLSPTMHRRFHRGAFTPDPAMSVAMRRPGRATVSVTEVEVNGHECTMSYFPGHPTETQLRTPQSIVQLQRAPTTKVSATKLQASDKTFDLEDIFREKNPRLHQKIPRWAFALLGWALGARRVNRILADMGAHAPQAFPERSLQAIGVEIVVLQPQHFTQLKDDEQPIIVANHPLGGVDGLAMLALAQSVFARVVAPVNDVLLRIPHARHLGVGIDKSRAGKPLVKAIAATFASDAPAVVFPAGKTSRIREGRLMDDSWGRMVVRQALRTGRPIIPVFISGRNSKLFYRLAALRKSLGIGINLEMFLLPREVSRPESPVTFLVVGEKITPRRLKTLGETDLGRAKALRDACYRLSDELPVVLR